ncbi:MAG TPA: NDP-sugar synthase [Actinomycetota bacterium]|nr:NDP-sugar synthase [Actinomycetota bacterium]
MAAVLFAAGRGQRLRPLTDEVAKPALPLMDVPLAAFGLLRLFESAPAVVLNLRHLPPSVTSAVAPYVPPDRRLDTLYETPEAYGTAGTLVALRDRLGPRVLTWNADLLTDLAAGDLLAAHEASGAPATIAVAEVGSGADFVVDGGRAVGFVDRRVDPGLAGVVFIGAAVFERAALDALPSTRPLGLGETLLASLARAGELGIHRHRGYWRDVGSPASYLAASLDLLAGRGPEPPGGPWPGEVVEVEGGRAYVGPGAAVSGALGPGSILLAGATVEAGASVERSIVWRGEVAPAGTVAEDCIWFGGRAIPL